MQLPHGAGPDEPFTFAVVGDVQGDERPSERWQALARWLADRDVAFLLQLGDFVQTGSAQAQWNAFFSCATPKSDPSLLHSTILMPVLGNHDHHNYDAEGNRLEPSAQLYLDQFRLPPNERDALNGRNCTFTYGPARFVIMDTTGHGADGSTHVEQTRWLASLNLEDRPWVMAGHHVPVVRFRNHVPSTAARRVWRPHFYRRFMDLVFNGHNHSHAVSWPLEGVDLDGWDGGRGFAGPWIARRDIGAESGMDALFLLEENDLVVYEGCEAVGRSVRTFALGTHQDVAVSARRALQPIDTGETREIWMGYAYEKLGKYYGGGGWELHGSSRPEQFVCVGTTRVMSQAGRHGHFRVALGERSAVSRQPIIEEGSVPEAPFFVLTKLTFAEDGATARLKAYQSPEPMPTEKPTDWDVVVQADGDWRLKLDTLTHHGMRANRMALLDEFRLGRRMRDVLLVPEDGEAGRAPLVEERFNAAP